jgi:hypothetical protein
MAKAQSAWKSSEKKFSIGRRELGTSSSWAISVYSSGQRAKRHGQTTIEEARATPRSGPFAERLRRDVREPARA